MSSRERGHGWIWVSNQYSCLFNTCGGRALCYHNQGTKHTVENLSILNDAVGEKYEVSRPARPQWRPNVPFIGCNPRHHGPELVHRET